MKIKTIRNNFLLWLITFFLIVASFGSAVIFSAKAQEEVSKNKYYDLLKDDEKCIYNAIEKMERDGLLLDGNRELDLIEDNYISEREIAYYQRGSDYLLKAFGSARDAYIMDNANNFYTDFSKLSLSFGSKDNRYTATMGTGRTDNYYLDGGFDSRQEIEQAKVILEEKIASLIGNTDGLTDLEKIEKANKIVVDNVSYDFCNDQAKNGFAPFIRTAYGALVNKYAVCEGYARALKVLLDKMGVTSKLVYGYLLDTNKNSLEPHMWNYVLLDNKWYAVDSTINDTMNNETYCFLQGADDFNYIHVEEKAFSQSGFLFTYPVLSKYSYGQEELQAEVSYVENNNNIDLNVKLSYKNLGSTKLEEQGLYLSFCYGTLNDESKNIVWGNWYAFSGNPTNNVTEEDTYTLFRDWGIIQYVKFAVFSEEPTGTFGLYVQTPNADSTVCESDAITNFYYDDNNYPAPFASKVSPKNTAKMDITQVYHMEFVYDEQLKKTNDNDVTISVASTHGATSDQYLLTNIIWDEANNTLSFDFEPSRMYLHNGDGYNFTPDNLVGINSRKTPFAVSYSFQYKSIVCNKILDSGALYMDVCAHPTLIDNSDLSMQNWIVDGKQVGENQRSQLALVVSTPNKVDQKDMTDNILDKENLEQEDILSASTYELELDLCGFLTQIPSGSYMKVAFGFPEGYSENDVGVTFKLYHFKRGVDNKIDPTKTVEIPCVITQYGLVAEIDSFSPFAVVAVPTNKVESLNIKGIYSRVIGSGGSIKIENESTNMAFVEKDEKIVFDVVAESGYEIDYVLLNRNQVNVVDNKIELSYSDLQGNNMLEASFVATRVKEYETQNGIVNLQKDFSTKLDVPFSKDRGIAIGFISIICGVIIIGAIFLIIYINKMKKSHKTNKK